MTLASPEAVKTYRDEFPIFRHSTYLNSCSLGALSVRARARVNEYLDLWENRGAPAWYEIWWSALADLRLRYGRLIGAGRDEIALRALVDPRLAIDLLRTGWAFRRRDWWRQRPFLPVPDRTYLRWRMYTAYASEDAVPPVEDVIRFARWRRETMRL